MTMLRPRDPAVGLLAALALAAIGAGLRPAAAAAQAATPAAPAHRFSDADHRFMSGMIVHHAQAILMAGWAPTHGASPVVRELCERIGISQRDEIAAMTRWLRERGLEVPAADTLASRRVSGMDAGMAGMSQAMPGMAGGPAMTMPGMLTGAQLQQLDSARGPGFDRLFLTDMIQHHQGALTMVAQLMNEPGAGEDGLVFQFATDVNADQTAEIDRMSRMIAALPPAPRSP